MSLGPVETLVTAAMLTIGTVTTRALPFVLFPSDREIPSYITYLGKVLPFTMIGFLVVYCLKGVSLTAAPYGLPELAALTAIVVLHLWKKNTLLSIATGTALYMLLI